MWIVFFCLHVILPTSEPLRTSSLQACGAVGPPGLQHCFVFCPTLLIHSVMFKLFLFGVGWTKSSLSFLWFIECFLEVFVVCDFVINLFGLFVLIWFIFKDVFVSAVHCLSYIPFIKSIFIIISSIIFTICNLINKLFIGDILHQLGVFWWIL